MSVPFSFGPSFQDSILSVMLKDMSFAEKCLDYIEAEYLISDAHKWLFGEIQKKFSETGLVPSYIEIEDVLKTEEKHKRRLYKSFAKRIFEAPVGSVDFIKTQLTDFAKRLAFAELFQHGQTLYNAGETGDAYDYVLEKINTLHSVSFHQDQIISIEDFDDIRKLHLAQRSLCKDKIPTGIEPIDAILLGGLSKLDGEFGIILGGPKTGKSISLLHMGFMGLTSLSGRVAHVVLEGSTEQTIIRYQSRLSGIPAKRIQKGDLSYEEEKRLEIVGNRYMKRLDLIPFNQHWEYTTGDLEGKLNELERKGRKPDLLVVDYADLLHSRTKQRDQISDQREVYRDMKRLSYMKRMATWSACQSTRPKDDPEKEILLRSRSAAESYDKIRIADFVMTLNQTSIEKETGILRVHCDIYRSNECDKTVWLVTDFNRMILYTKRYGYKLSNTLPEWHMKSKRRKKSLRI